MDSDWRRLLVSGPVRRPPADVVALLSLLALGLGAASLPGVRGTPLAVFLSLPLVLFVPGYALVAAVFPGGRASGETAHADASTGDSPRVAQWRGLDSVERLVLSFGFSIVVVGVLGGVLSVTPWGVRLFPVVVCVSVLTVVLTAVAVRRRPALAPNRRFRVSHREWAATARRVLRPDDRTDVALNAVLVCSVVLATVSVGYALAAPKQADTFTELYLVTETADGELVADDYPTEFTAGDTRPLVVGIGNHEHRRETYTLLVRLQRVRQNSTRVVATDRLGTRAVALSNDETSHVTLRVTPTMTGQRLRLAFLLYRGAPPAEPTMENAYRKAHLWVTVTADEGTPSAR